MIYHRVKLKNDSKYTILYIYLIVFPFKAFLTQWINRTLSVYDIKDPMSRSLNFFLIQCTNGRGTDPKQRED